MFSLASPGQRVPITPLPSSGYNIQQEQEASAISSWQRYQANPAGATATDGLLERYEATYGRVCEKKCCEDGDEENSPLMQQILLNSNGVEDDRKMPAEGLMALTKATKLKDDGSGNDSSDGSKGGDNDN